MSRNGIKERKDFEKKFDEMRLDLDYPLFFKCFESIKRGIEILMNALNECINSFIKRYIHTKITDEIKG